MEQFDVRLKLPVLSRSSFGILTILRDLFMLPLEIGKKDLGQHYVLLQLYETVLEVISWDPPHVVLYCVRLTFLDSRIVWAWETMVTPFPLLQCSATCQYRATVLGCQEYVKWYWVKIPRKLLGEILGLDSEIVWAPFFYFLSTNSTSPGHLVSSWNAYNRPANVQ